MDVGIDDHPFEVRPDVHILPAVKGAPGQRPMLADGAVTSTAIQMTAVTGPIIGDPEGLCQVAADDPLAQLLFLHDKGKAATGRPA